MLPIRFFPDFKRKQASHIIQTVSQKKKNRKHSTCTSKNITICEENLFLAIS